MQDESIDEFIERRTRELVAEAAAMPPRPKCDHEWEHGEWPGGAYGPTECTKCGMSFMRYAHTECV